MSRALSVSDTYTYELSVEDDDLVLLRVFQRYAGNDKAYLLSSATFSRNGLLKLLQKGGEQDG